MEENEKKKLNVLVYANPEQFGNITKNFYSPECTELNLVMPVGAFDLRTAAGYLESMKIDVLIAEPHVYGFSMTDFLSLRQKSERPILLVGIANAGPDMEQFSHSSLDLCYMLPLNESSMAKMNEELPRKLAAVSKSWKRGVWDSISTQEIRNIVSRSGNMGWQKSVIACWSPKGGVGKTTVAIELASVLASLGGRNVCILDTNMNGGHVRLRLNIESEHSILSVATMIAGAKNNNRDWSSAQQEISEGMEKFLIPVQGIEVDHRYNFYCIPGITSQAQATHDYLRGANGAEFMRTLIDYLKQRFDFIIIDVGSSVNVTMHKESFRNADHILVVCDSDAACIADTKRTVAKDLASQFPVEKFSLVLNRWQGDVGIQMEEVAANIGIRPRGSIINDFLGGVTKAGNSGCSYVVSNYNRTDNPEVTEICMEQFVYIASTFFSKIWDLWTAHKEELKNLKESKKNKRRGLFGFLRKG